MVSDEKLLEEVRRLGSDGKPPTGREWREEARWARSTFIRHFGSWNAGLREAGFEPNQVKNHSKKRLLQAIRKYSDGSQAPRYDEFDESASIGCTTILEKFGTWWKAVVQAGLIPQERTPLSASQFIRFHKAAIDRSSPTQSLIGLFLLFTGLPAALLSRIEQSWFSHLSDERYGTTVTVPADHLPSMGTDEWTFKLPTTYTIDGVTRETQLPDLAQWFFLESPYPDPSFPVCMTISRLPYRIAEDADISRRLVSRCGLSGSPSIQSSDLRASAGVQMARNGAPKRRIQRHLGIKHTDWQADVEDFFLWLYVHEGFVHPDYDSPDVVLNPAES